MPIKYHKIFFILVLFFLVSASNAQKSLKSIDKELGECYDRKQFDSAFFLSEQLLKEARKKDSSLYIVKALYQKALSLNAMDSVKLAIDVYYEGLKACKDTSHNRYKASILNNLGVINSEQKNFDVAKSYHKQEIQTRKEIGDTARIITGLINLSSMHRRLKELDSSGYVLAQAKAFMGVQRDSKTFAHFNHAMGTHFQTLYKRDSLSSQLDSAVKYYSSSLNTWIKLKNMKEALRPLFNMGLIYHARKDFAKALENYKKAEEIVTNGKLEQEKVTVYGNLAELYWDMGDFRRSSDYFRTYIETKDALQKEEVNYYALELDKQHQSEKQKEIIQAQKLELAERNKRMYLYLFLAALAFVLLILIIGYFSFTKRLRLRVEAAKKKFFTNVVHEIRTPLSMIQAPLSVLRSKAHSQEDESQFELAERNVKRLNELITQMLDISKIETDKYVLNATFGDLELFFLHIVSNYSKMALEKNIALITNFNFNSKLAFFDKDALEKITGNLLDNAIKYSTVGSQVGISAGSDETEHGIELYMNVWDTGIGIPLADQQNIFNRFYRSSKTKGESSGTGIGLSLVKDLVDLQKGTISFASEEGSGSSFAVNLSLKNAGQISGAFTSAGSGVSAYQVLLVEDDRDILDFNAGLLAKNNLNVLRATTAEEALKLIEKNLPDLIVSDIMLPGMQGAEFLRTIRKNPETDHIPFIVLSAKLSVPSRMDLLDAGAQNYLTKPFLPNELVAVVLNQLEILDKRKKEFKQLIEAPEKKTDEKFTEQDPYIKKLYEMILKNLDDASFSVERLADLMAINRSHFQRKVKALTGFSPSEIIKTIRLEKAKELLLKKAGNVTEVADLTGFSSQSYFTKCFTEHFGVTPTQIVQKEQVEKRE
jgi:signal transduction histidine kinase/CheY-like chemotaxis protein/AraC-like DNA-binding protein